jgi:hypothetical protein
MTAPAAAFDSSRHEQAPAGRDQQRRTPGDGPIPTLYQRRHPWTSPSTHDCSPRGVGEPRCRDVEQAWTPSGRARETTA